MARVVNDKLGGGGKKSQTTSSNTTDKNKGLTQQQLDRYKNMTEHYKKEHEENYSKYLDYIKRQKEQEDSKSYAEQTMQFTELIGQRREIQQLMEEAEMLKSIVLKSGDDFNTGYGGQRAILVEGYSNNILSNLDGYIETLKAMDAKLAEEQSRITGENIVPVTDTRKTTERVEINNRGTMYYDSVVLKGEVLPQYDNIDIELNQMFDKLMSIGGIGEYDGMSELQNKGLSQIEAMQDSNGRLKENVQGIVDSVEDVDRENQQRQREIAERKTAAILGIATREEQEEIDSQRELEEQERLESQREIAENKMNEILEIIPREEQEEIDRQRAREESKERERQREQQRRRAAVLLNKQNQLFGAEGNLTFKELQELSDNLLGDYLEPGETYDRYATELDQIYLRYAMEGNYSNLDKDINDLLDRISIELEEREKTIREIAQQCEVDTDGKTVKEILYEIAEKRDVHTTGKEVIITGDTSQAIEDWKACGWGRNYNGPSGSETWYIDWKNPSSFKGLERALAKEYMRLYGGGFTLP